MSTSAHCMKCGAESATTNVTRITYANGRTAERGTCAGCGTKTSKFVKAGA